MPRRHSGARRPAVYLLKHISNALRIALDEALEPGGMTVAQVAVLSALNSQPDLSNADLARLTFVQPQSMVPLLKTLEARGWIARQPAPSGGRSMPARLTSDGEKHLRIGWAAAITVEERMLSGLTENERERFAEMLERCLASLGART
jgi:DNA-binding MarR family transcriptional regulator